MDSKEEFRSLVHKSQYTNTPTVSITNIPELTGELLTRFCQYIIVRLSNERKDKNLLDRHNDIYYLILRRSKAVGSFFVADSERIDAWRKDSESDMAILSFTKHPEYDTWELRLLGFEQRLGKSAFNEQMKFEEKTAKLIDPHAIVEGPQYMVKMEDLKSTITAKPQEKIMEEEIPLVKTKKMHTSISNILIVSDIDYFAENFPSRFSSLYVMTAGTDQCILNRMTLYRRALQIKVRMDKWSMPSGDAFKIITDSYSVFQFDRLDIQRYTILVMLILCVGNKSLTEFVFYCEEIIYNLLCQESQKKHNCQRFKTSDSNAECNVMTHLDVLRDLFDALQSIEPEMTKCENLVTGKNIMIKKIVSNMGPIENIYENMISETNRENDYITDDYTS